MTSTDISSPSYPTIPTYIYRVSPFDVLCLGQKPRANLRYDPTRRAHMYIMYGGCYGVGVIAARNIIQGIIHYHWPGKDAQAMSSIEVKKSDIPLGSCIVVSWKDKPVFLWHRTPKQIADAEADDHVEMRDPQTDTERVKGIECLYLCLYLSMCAHCW